jgi:hypothetical protein
LLNRRNTKEREREREREEDRERERERVCEMLIAKEIRNRIVTYNVTINVWESIKMISVKIEEVKDKLRMREEREKAKRRERGKEKYEKER